MIYIINVFYPPVMITQLETVYQHYRVIKNTSLLFKLTICSIGDSMWEITRNLFGTSTGCRRVDERSPASSTPADTWVTGVTRIMTHPYGCPHAVSTGAVHRGLEHRHKSVPWIAPSSPFDHETKMVLFEFQSLVSWRVKNSHFLKRGSRTHRQLRNLKRKGTE